MLLDHAASHDALEYLRAGLTTAEREWPRFHVELRPVRTVGIHELTTHPDFVDRVASIAPQDAWLLMGVVVLVTEGGAIYAIARGTHVLMFRVGPPLANETREAVTTPIPPSMGGGRFTLPNDWVNVKSAYVSETGDVMAELRALAA